MEGPTLDFGCGTGCLTMALRDGLGERVTGVDTSRAMLEQFDRKAEGHGVTTVAIEVGPRIVGQKYVVACCLGVSDVVVVVNAGDVVVVSCCRCRCC